MQTKVKHLKFTGNNDIVRGSKVVPNNSYACLKCSQQNKNWKFVITSWSNALLTNSPRSPGPWTLGRRCIGVQAREVFRRNFKGNKGSSFFLSLWLGSPDICNDGSKNGSDNNSTTLLIWALPILSSCSYACYNSPTTVWCSPHSTYTVASTMKSIVKYVWITIHVVLENVGYFIDM